MHRGSRLSRFNSKGFIYFSEENYSHEQDYKNFEPP